MYGPTNPPRFPTELIRPIAAAAADSVRNAVGNGQNPGKYPSAPAATMQKAATTSNGLPPAAITRRYPTAPSMIAPAACHRLSPVRSDDLPTASIPASPARCGIIATIVTFRSLQPDAPLRIVGSQMFRP